MSNKTKDVSICTQAMRIYRKIKMKSEGEYEEFEYEYEELIDPTEG